MGKHGLKYLSYLLLGLSLLIPQISYSATAKKNANTAHALKKTPPAPKPIPPNPLACTPQNNYLDSQQLLNLKKTKELLKSLSFSCSDCSCASVASARSLKGIEALQRSPAGLPLIPSECIAESMSLGADLGSRFAKCGAKTEEAASYSKDVPCITPTSLQLNHTWVNLALQCMNSPFRPLQPDDVKEIFAIINHESRFQPNVDSVNGRCLMQLTNVAAKAFYQSDYPKIRQYWDAVKARTECAPFKKYVADGLHSRTITLPRTDVETGPQDTLEVVTSCQFVSAGEPPAKCLMIGMSLYLSYFDMAEELIKEAIEAKIVLPKDQARMTRLLARGFYNRGPAPSQKVWRNIFINAQKRKNKNPQAILEPAEFTKAFEHLMPKYDAGAKHFKYLSRTDRDYDLLTKKLDRSCP